MFKWQENYGIVKINHQLSLAFVEILGKYSQFLSIIASGGSHILTSQWWSTKCNIICQLGSFREKKISLAQQKDDGKGKGISLIKLYFFPRTHKGDSFSVIKSYCSLHSTKLEHTTYTSEHSSLFSQTAKDSTLVKKENKIVFLSSFSSADSAIKDWIISSHSSFVGKLNENRSGLSIKLVNFSFMATFEEG